MSNDKKLGDYDIWYKPCENCGYNTGKSTGGSNRCWKCGRTILRDYSDRALKIQPTMSDTTEKTLQYFKDEVARGRGFESYYDSIISGYKNKQSHGIVEEAAERYARHIAHQECVAFMYWYRTEYDGPQPMKGATINEIYELFISKK